MSEDDDHYAALDLAPDAPADEVRAAWRFLLAAFHPDRFRDTAQRERAEEITKRVNAAWQVLGDEDLRARYDRLRAAAEAAESHAVARTVRELPCPSCATRCRAEDTGGRLTRLACPACGETFSAMLGAHCVDRPRLQRSWLGLRYEAIFADDSGQRHTVSFRRLPQELALSEGEQFSIVFDPRARRPVYAIVHGDTIDIGWRVG